jgi:soluble lytic murein transglycosylase
MEKRLKKTAALTLSCLTCCAQAVLVIALFVPVLLALRYLPSDIQQPGPSIQKARPKELVQIYSIVRANRPDIDDGEAWLLSDVIWQESSGYGLDPILVLAVIDVESKFQYAVVSPAGARGIMQILPDVAQSLLYETDLHPPSTAIPFTPESLDDPILNIKLGVYYLQALRKSFPNLNHTLTAYNRGPTETRNRLENDLEISHEYATTVLTAYRQYRNQEIKLPTF